MREGEGEKKGEEGFENRKAHLSWGKFCSGWKLFFCLCFLLKSGQTVLGRVLGTCLDPADGDVQPECVLDVTSQESQVKPPREEL